MGVDGGIRNLKRKLQEEDKISVYALSLSKLNQFKSSGMHFSLVRSVLICNTVRRLEYELGINNLPVYLPPIESALLNLDIPPVQNSLTPPLEPESEIFKDVDVSLYDYDPLSPPSQPASAAAEDLLRSLTSPSLSQSLQEVLS